MNKVLLESALDSSFIWFILVNPKHVDMYDVDLCRWVTQSNQLLVIVRQKVESPFSLSGRGSQTLFKHIADVDSSR